MSIYQVCFTLSSPTEKVQPPGPTDLQSLTSPDDGEVSQFEILERLQKEYGDVFKYKTFAGEMYVFNHPYHIKQIFQRLDVIRTPLLRVVLGEGVLAADNKHWQHQRRLMLPMFQRQKIIRYTALIRDITISHVEEWKHYANSGEPVDVVQLMTRLTISIISMSLFSVDMNKESNSFLTSFTTTIEYLGEIANATSFSHAMQISPATNTKFHNAMEQMDKVVADIIENRQNTSNRPDDLLSLLLEAVDAETGKPLTNEHVRDEVMTMLLAGHETTSLGLTWLWYLLDRHPDIGDRVGRETDETLADRKINYEDIVNLGYSRMVIEETMRLYPPVAVVWRQPRADIELGGYTIPEGSGILVSPYLAHRHKDFWPDAEAFDPQRFNPETAPKLHPYAYFPFGGGRHLCLGKHFAMLESQIILATVLQYFRIRLLSREPAIPHFLITLRPKDGLLCTLEPRFTAKAR